MMPFCRESTQLWQKFTTIDRITVRIDYVREVVFYQCDAYGQ